MIWLIWARFLRKHWVNISRYGHSPLMRWMPGISRLSSIIRGPVAILLFSRFCRTGKCHRYHVQLSGMLLQFRHPEKKSLIHHWSIYMIWKISNAPIRRSPILKDRSPVQKSLPAPFMVLHADSPRSWDAGPWSTLEHGLDSTPRGINWSMKQFWRDQAQSSGSHQPTMKILW